MKKRKILSLLLSLCLLIGLLPTVALAADQTNAGAGIRIQYVDGSYDKTTGIMKVHVQAKMPAGTGITTIGTLLSWDNTKLSLVSQYDSTYDYTPADGVSADPASDAMNTIMATKKKSGPPVPGAYTVTDGKVYTKDARTALYTYHANTDPLTYVGTDAQTGGNWFDVYEVMFRVTGKPDDPATVLNSDSLRIADVAKGDDAVMKGAFPANDIYSIYLTDNSDPARLYVLNRMSGCSATEVTGEKSLMTAPETGTATYPGSTNSPSPAAKTLSSIAVTTAPTKTTYTAGENFDPAGMVVTATYSDSSTAAVTTYTVTDGNSLTAGKTSVNISYTEGSVTKTCTQDIVVNAAPPAPVTLSGISVKTAPDKVDYTEGESFDKTGMVIEATYSDSSKKNVTTYTYTPTGALTTSDTEVTISYTEGGVTKTCTQAITVNAAPPAPVTLSGISVKTAPDKVDYTEGESFDKTGMVIEATYSDSSKKNVTTYTYTPTGALTTSDTEVTISYTEGGVTKTCTQTIVVNAHWTYTGGGVTTYSITVKSAKNGDVTASHKSASKGTTVTLTVDPDKGYVLDTLTVLDGKDKEIKLTEKNGKYTFTMPSGKVTVEAMFEAEQPTVKNPFIDVPAGSYYEDAVIWAVDKGITTGTGNGRFSPDAPCTRAQIVTFLWRAAGSPAPKSMSSFSDVPAEAFYAKAVAWAVEKGITSGTGDGKFSPDATCTRAQAVTFLYRANGSPAVSGNSAFTDVAADAYYAAAVKWAEKNGITGGIGGGLFGSDNNCTRAQIVTFLYRSVK